jgi:hypothetical protein
MEIEIREILKQQLVKKNGGTTPQGGACTIIISGAFFVI